MASVARVNLVAERGEEIVGARVSIDGPRRGALLQSLGACVVEAPEVPIEEIIMTGLGPVAEGDGCLGRRENALAEGNPEDLVTASEIDRDFGHSGAVCLHGVIVAECLGNVARDESTKVLPDILCVASDHLKGAPRKAQVVANKYLCAAGHGWRDALVVGRAEPDAQARGLVAHVESDQAEHLIASLVQPVGLGLDRGADSTVDNVFDVADHLDEGHWPPSLRMLGDWHGRDLFEGGAGPATVEDEV